MFICLDIVSPDPDIIPRIGGKNIRVIRQRACRDEQRNKITCNGIVRNLMGISCIIMVYTVAGVTGNGITVNRWRGILHVDTIAVPGYCVVAVNRAARIIMIYSGAAIV